MLHFAPSDARLRISVGEVHGHRHRNRVVVRVAEPLLGPQWPWSPVTGDIFSAIKMAISNRTIIFGINFFQVIYGFMEFLSRFLGFVVNFQGLQSCKIPTIGAPNMNRVSINQRIKDSVWEYLILGKRDYIKLLFWIGDLSPTDSCFQSGGAMRPGVPPPQLVLQLGFLVQHLSSDQGHHSLNINQKRYQPSSTFTTRLPTIYHRRSPWKTPFLWN